MRISTKGRYSLEAMLYIALRPDAVYANTREIAAKTGVSEGYLEQLFIPLRKAGLISGIRGPQGGYILGKNPVEISVGDILRSVEGNLKPVPCVDDKVCPLESSCTSRHTWSGLYKGIKTYIDAINLNDLVVDCKKNTEPEYMI
jgi:Rrf2 family protein